MSARTRERFKNNAGTTIEEWKHPRLQGNAIIVEGQAAIAAGYTGPDNRPR
jgi:hypothetical protein